jgi:pimeloyl-ACP methyl ester carboxylesterase
MSVPDAQKIVVRRAGPNMIRAALITCWFAASACAANAAAVDSGYVNVPGGRLFYESVGEGEAVVLVHDGILHRETWDEQFPALAENRRLIRYDRRGYGRSAMPTAPYSSVDDLQALFEALHIGRATLIGCSAGDSLSIDFTIAHPDEVRGLILVGAVVRGLAVSDHFHRAAAACLPQRTRRQARRSSTGRGGTRTMSRRPRRRRRTKCESC